LTKGLDPINQGPTQETRFIYATYGEGELPEGLTIYSKESSETSDLLGD